MTHEDVWRAIENFAMERNMSCSGLAKCSGLDPTTFNKSKRWSKQGQPRWPSTNSISNVAVWTQQHSTKANAGQNRDNQDGLRQTVFLKYWHLPGLRWKILLNSYHQMNEICNFNKMLQGSVFSDIV